MDSSNKKNKEDLMDSSNKKNNEDLMDNSNKKSRHKSNGKFSCIINPSIRWFKRRCVSLSQSNCSIGTHLHDIVRSNIKYNLRSIMIHLGLVLQDRYIFKLYKS